MQLRHLSASLAIVLVRDLRPSHRHHLGVDFSLSVGFGLRDSVLRNITDLGVVVDLLKLLPKLNAGAKTIYETSKTESETHDKTPRTSFIK